MPAYRTCVTSSFHESRSGHEVHPGVRRLDKSPNFSRIVTESPIHLEDVVHPCRERLPVTTKVRIHNASVFRSPNKDDSRLPGGRLFDDRPRIVRGFPVDDAIDTIIGPDLLQQRFQKRAGTLLLVRQRRHDPKLPLASAGTGGLAAGGGFFGKAFIVWLGHHAIPKHFMATFGTVIDNFLTAAPANGSPEGCAAGFPGVSGFEGGLPHFKLRR